MTDEGKQIGFYSSILIDAVESGWISRARVRNYEWKGQNGGTVSIPVPSKWSRSQLNPDYIIATVQLAPDDPEYVTVPMINTNGIELRVTVDYKMIRKGLNKILSGDVRASDWIVTACTKAKKEWDGAYMDAICADAVVQSAVFDEVIYG